MAPASELADSAALVVADSSAVISLVATGAVGTMLSALPNRVVVVDTILEELEAGQRYGRTAYDALTSLVAAKAIDVVTLDSDAALGCFEDLVVGPTAHTLDDGEAATIAYAWTHGGTAIIDERKARRICRQRFQALHTACTVDVLLHPDVQLRLGPEMIGDSVFNALVDARMRVLPEHLEWVISVIGEQRAAKCQSLPRRLRPSLAPTSS